MGRGGEVFLLDMGEQVRIVDLARKLITLSGFEPEVDIPIRFVGLRPGEKLYEELLVEDNGVVRTEHEKIWVADKEKVASETVLARVEELLASADRGDVAGAVRALAELVPEFAPTNEDHIRVLESRVRSGGE
jgi:FlaA1/EpsC-like NDP-sugar epimerase